MTKDLSVPRETIKDFKFLVSSSIKKLFSHVGSCFASVCCVLMLIPLQDYAPI